MTAHSQNGWPVTDIHPVSYRIPGANRVMQLVPGPVGFILACHTLWFHEHVEALSPESIPDDWSYDPSQRNVRDGSDISNHCSATALDLNARKHPRSPTYNPSAAGFTQDQVYRIRKRLRRYEAIARGMEVHNVIGTNSNTGNWIIRWGYDYSHSTDGMHFEWNESPRLTAEANRLAARLSTRHVGKAILEANLHAKEQING